MIDNSKYKGILVDKNNVPIPGTDFFGWKSRSLAVMVVILSKTRSGLYSHNDIINNVEPAVLSSLLTLIWRSVV